ncbi:MAG: pilus assembly protein [Deltaproteobacteria bacterium]|nr:MAG: hypothetical protein B1H13_01670 [Desulfobacteraceae bacterium 4484_190.3]RLB17493.1 MAG: pilus assembly protein [Deltaproteobacteria bacterium]
MTQIVNIARITPPDKSQQVPPATHLEYLIEKRVITRDELRRAKAEAHQGKRSVESVLLKKMNISKNKMGRAIAEYYHEEYLPFDPHYPAPGDLLSRLNPTYLKKNCWVPLCKENGVLRVLIDDPRAFSRIQDIKSLIPAKQYTFAFGFAEDIYDFIDSFYGLFNEEQNISITDLLGKLETPDPDESEHNPLSVYPENNIIISLVNKIIVDAYGMGCSDIHVEPYPGRSGVEIRVRVDGHCHEYITIPYNYKRAFISRIKIMADLDISERRKPQDGKIKFRKFYPLDIELRVATMPTAGGEEDIVMRILTAGEPIPLTTMGMTQRDYDLLLHMSRKPYGMLLVVGPTGSGKTTTLHSVLSTINTPGTKIWTAEDPVEITQRGLRQVQVQPKIGFDFAVAMRSLLRADPDVIMVGEMRDQETASIACEASLTGHLVMSTLHTNSAPETITRLIDMDMDAFNLADAILGILAQRLVRTLCVHCKEAYHPSRDEYNAMVRRYGNGFDKLRISYRRDLLLYRAAGCPECHNTGYKGRTAIIEFLEATPDIKALILNNPHVEKIRQQAIKDGMTTLMQDGIRKVFLGLTDLNQVRRVCI